CGKSGSPTSTRAIPRPPTRRRRSERLFFLPRLRGRVGRGPAASKLAQAARTYPPLASLRTADACIGVVLLKERRPKPACVSPASGGEQQNQLNRGALPPQAA